MEVKTESSSHPYGLTRERGRESVCVRERDRPTDRETETD